MKSRVVSSIGILGLFFVLAVAGVQAQTATRGEVNLLFDFTAGTATLKAGRYNIRKMNGNVISFRTEDGSKRVLVDAPLVVGARDSKAGARLVFNRYGDLYFLAQVWLNADTGRQLFPSQAESRTRNSQLARGIKAERVEVVVQGN
jgi:hypothetical protein